MILPHALHLQSQRARLDFRIQNSSHEIPLVRPKVQQTFVVLAGNRIFRVCQIERDGAVFHHHRGACSSRKPESIWLSESGVT